MPITNRQDASDVDQHITEIFGAGSTVERVERIRRLFVEKLDFEASFQEEVSLEGTRRGVTLPTVGYRLASLETTEVVYVDLSETKIDTDRVLKREASDAAQLISADHGADVLMVFTNRSCSQLHFILPSFEGRNPSLRRMVIERDLPRRTAVQQLSNIYWEWDRTGNIRSALEAVFDVEAVTREFFDEYKRVFNRAMELVEGFGEDHEAKNLFVQTLFNRLMFIYFLSRKGWLRFDGSNDYLNALWGSYASDVGQSNFYVDRLKQLFFVGLNNPSSRDLMGGNSALNAVIGDVPFLNGGLFDKADIDDDPDIVVPDESVEPILSELFDRFNFTVMESTPLDVEVAVDPEMLGKMFEELVTGRHESGSYYTPRLVVSFMCREALKGYLAGRHPEIAGEAIKSFVEDHDTSRISEDEAPAVGQSLVEITVVDPACGSGAYLLGMMQELVDLRSSLYSAQLKRDALSLYRTKLSIIERNLYGADIDDFAVNIAMLRLWLSLVIEHEDDYPEPLPNLDYKIVCGDSLLGPDPTSEGGTDFYRHLTVESDLRGKKARYMRASEFNDKQRFKHEIDGVVATIRGTMGDATPSDGTVDWSIDFADVFAANYGFDVVVANPPYVRQEKIGESKSELRKLYADSTVARSDLYCYFYVRALQLLRTGGVQVFVCSNSWLDVGYGAKLQQHLLRNARVDAIYESAVERQFSTAQINTIISVISKSMSEVDEGIRFVSLRDEFEVAISDARKRRDTLMSKAELMNASLGSADAQGRRKFVGDKWGAKYLRAPDIYRTVMKKGEGKLVRLGDVASVRRGVTTGANDFFVLAREEAAKWGIEDEFLEPVMLRSQESASIAVEVPNLNRRLFMCDAERRRLIGSGALDYIQWGEMKGYNQRRSVAGRGLWYNLGDRKRTRLAMNYQLHSTARTFYANEGMLVSDNLQEIHGARESETQLCASMNSSITQLQFNVTGRGNFGGGMIKIQTYELANMPIIDPGTLPALNDEIFRTPDWDVMSPSRERRLIDDAVFDVLGLTQGERDGVYDGVRELVENRMRRARSV